MKKTFYSISTLAMLLSSNVYALKVDTLYCDGCNNAQMKSIALNSANNSNARYLVLNTTGAVSQEILITQSDDSGNSDEEIDEESSGAKITVYTDADKYELQVINQALVEFRDINNAIKAKTQLPIELKRDFAFKSIFNAMESSRTERDFHSVLQKLLNTDEFNEIRRRAENQIRLIETDAGVSFKAFSLAVGKLIQDSTWLVNFTDGTSVPIKIKFQRLASKISVVITVDFTQASDKDGKRVPQSKYTVGGYSASGDTIYIHKIGQYFKNMGIRVGYDSKAGYKCVPNGISCKTDESCKISYQCGT